MKKYLKFLLPIGALALSAVIIAPVVISCSNSSTPASSDSTFYSMQEAMAYLSTQTNKWLKSQKEQTYNYQGKDYKINPSEGFLLSPTSFPNNVQPGNSAGPDYQPDIVDNGKAVLGIYNMIELYTKIEGDRLVAFEYNENAIAITLPMEPISIKIALSALQPPTPPNEPETPPPPTFYSMQEALEYLSTQTNEWLKSQKEQTYNYQGKDYKINPSKDFLISPTSYNVRPGNSAGSNYQPEIVDNGKAYLAVFNIVEIYTKIEGDRLVAFEYNENAIGVLLSMEPISIKIASSAFPQPPASFTETKF